MYYRMANKMGLMEERRQKFLDRYPEIFGGLSEEEGNSLLIGFNCKADDLNSFMEFLLLCNERFGGYMIKDFNSILVLSSTNFHFSKGFNMDVFSPYGRISLITVSRDYSDFWDSEKATELARYMYSTCSFKIKLLMDL